MFYVGGLYVNQYFKYDKRLKIFLPHLNVNWNQYNLATQNKIVEHWEQIRGGIPDRIHDLEEQINQKQAELNQEDDFNKSCQLNEDIADLASIINDLWIWFRTTQSITKTHT